MAETAAFYRKLGQETMAMGQVPRLV